MPGIKKSSLTFSDLLEPAERAILKVFLHRRRVSGSVERSVAVVVVSIQPVTQLGQGHLIEGDSER